jgi:hypothetical protein
MRTGDPVGRCPWFKVLPRGRPAPLLHAVPGRLHF